MARKLNNPTPATIILNNIDKQYVDRIVIDPAIVGTVDGNGDPNGSEIDLTKSGINYNVVSVDITGKKMKAVRSLTLFWEDLSPADAAILRQFMNILYADAEAKGMFEGDATSSDDV